MGLEFYKPTKTNKGALASFTFTSKNDKGEAKGALFVSLVKQTSYDAARHNGGFKDGARKNVKLGVFEIGGILRSLRTSQSVKFVHTGQNGTTNINFGPYFRKDNAGTPTDEIAGFGLQISSQAQGEERQNFSIPFNFDEAEILIEYLSFVLDHFFSAIYSEDKARAQAYSEKKNVKASLPPKTDKKASPSNTDDFAPENESTQPSSEDQDALF